MRKRIFATLLSLVLMLSFSVSVFADTNTRFVTPEVLLLTESPIYTGQQFTLRATTEKHAPEVNDYWTFQGVVSSGSRIIDLAEKNYINTVTFTAPAMAGTYTISYYIRMSTKPGSDNGTVNEWIGEGFIDVLVHKQIVVENPAAPAVANAILKEAGIAHRYLIKGKTYGNYISDVAQYMGPGTDFEGVDKDDVEAYRTAVWNFLVAKGADLK